MKLFGLWKVGWVRMTDAVVDYAGGQDLPLEPLGKDCGMMFEALHASSQEEGGGFEPLPELNEIEPPEFEQFREWAAKLGLLSPAQMAEFSTEMDDDYDEHDEDVLDDGYYEDDDFYFPLDDNPLEDDPHGRPDAQDDTPLDDSQESTAPTSPIESVEESQDVDVSEPTDETAEDGV